MVETVSKKKNQFIEIKLGNYLKKIDNLLDYDIYIIFQFNLNKNIAVNKGYYLKEKYQDFNIKIPNSIFFQGNSKYLLKDLIDKKEVIEYVHEDNSKCLFNGIKREIYIPLFILKEKDMHLIGCLYCGTYKDKDLEFDTLLKKVQYYIFNMSQLLVFSMAKTKISHNIINIIHVLLMILERKDNTLFFHSYNVANWCKKLGTELNLDELEIRKLYIAGLLHDVGKTFISDSILNKKGKLTEEEYNEVKKHSLYSYNISKKLLAEYPDLHDLPKTIKYHHERYDGGGYPEGLKGEEITFYSYILSISDSVDAMLSERPYKKGYSIEKVIKELYINKGKQFHPKLVDVMIDILSKAQRDYKDILDNQLSLCYLIINYDKDIHIFQGALMKRENYYIFSPNDELKADKVKFKEIMSAEMVVKDSTTVFNYKVNIKDIENNEFFISSIELMDSPNSFNLFWDLEGILYLSKENREILVHISQIGGNFLRFSSRETIIFKHLSNIPLKIDILFDDYTVDVTGIIIKSYKLGHSYYCDFKYTNIPDFKRDKIFRQLFRKQIEIRRLIASFEDISY